jgi:hypothetical protein
MTFHSAKYDFKHSRTNEDFDFSTIAGSTVGTAVLHSLFKLFN